MAAAGYSTGGKTLTEADMLELLADHWVKLTQPAGASPAVGASPLWVNQLEFSTDSQFSGHHKHPQGIIRTMEEAAAIELSRPGRKQQKFDKK